MRGHGFEEERPTLPGRTSGRPRILLAEDDDELRELLVALLVRDGYEVISARSGEDAVRLLEELSIRDRSTSAVDLVLTDVCMSGMSGMKLGEMIRAVHWPIPVIFMTAYPEASVHREAERLQAALLPKPFKSEFLRRIVLSMLAAHVRERHVLERPDEGNGVTH
ncbi:MAG: response regulator [Polyangiaceae bacterium]